MDGGSHTANSSTREKILEHLFVGELLRCLWLKGIFDVEVLHSEVDAGGYDLVIECIGVLRHIQLKASHKRASTASVGVNVRLSGKPSGCVVWMKFDPETLLLGPFLWLGGAPGAALPDLGNRMGRHTRGNSLGHKRDRKSIRIVSATSFRRLESIDHLVMALFGAPTPVLGDASLSSE